VRDDGAIGIGTEREAAAEEGATLIARLADQVAVEIQLRMGIGAVEMNPALLRVSSITIWLKPASLNSLDFTHRGSPAGMPLRTLFTVEQATGHYRPVRVAVEEGDDDFLPMRGTQTAPQIGRHWGSSPAPSTMPPHCRD
jgi:hypothetical protein